MVLRRLVSLSILTTTILLLTPMASAAVEDYLPELAPVSTDYLFDGPVIHHGGGEGEPPCPNGEPSCMCVTGYYGEDEGPRGQGIEVPYETSGTDNGGQHHDRGSYWVCI